MPLRSLNSKYRSLEGRARDAAQRLNAGTNGWLGVAGGAMQATFSSSAGTTAAALAYYELFSLFPLILLSIALASLQADSTVDGQTVVDWLEFVAPALGSLFGQTIEEISSVRAPVTGASLISLLWSASAYFYTLGYALCDLWGVTRAVPFWKRRGQAIFIVLALVGGILLAASFASSAITALQPLLSDQIVWISGGLNFLLSTGLNVAGLTVVYLVFPHGRAGVREILPGAVAAGLLWELAKKAFLLFVSSYVASRSLVYGSVAGIIAFLFWAYITGRILLFGVHVTIAVHRRKVSAQPG